MQHEIGYQVSCWSPSQFVTASLTTLAAKGFSLIETPPTGTSYTLKDSGLQITFAMPGWVKQAQLSNDEHTFEYRFNYNDATTLAIMEFPVGALTPQPAAVFDLIQQQLKIDHVAIEPKRLTLTSQHASQNAGRHIFARECRIPTPHGGTEHFILYQQWVNQRCIFAAGWSNNKHLMPAITSALESLEVLPFESAEIADSPDSSPTVTHPLQARPSSIKHIEMGMLLELGDHLIFDKLFSRAEETFRYGMKLMPESIRPLSYLLYHYQDQQNYDAFFSYAKMSKTPLAMIIYF